MRKLSFIAVAALMFLSFAACDQKSKPVQNATDEEVEDTIALKLEAEADSQMIEGSEISIPDFMGIVEAYTDGNSATSARHLKAIGLKALDVKKDSASADTVYMAWSRGADYVPNAGGPLALRFKSDLVHGEALALYVNKNKQQASQLFFTDKRLVPVYVKELQSMGYQLKPEKSNETTRRYESGDGDDFMESFTIVIGNEGCAVIMQSDMEEQDD